MLLNPIKIRMFLRSPVLFQILKVLPTLAYFAHALLLHAAASSDPHPSLPLFSGTSSLVSKHKLFPFGNIFILLLFFVFLRFFPTFSFSLDVGQKWLLHHEDPPSAEDPVGCSSGRTAVPESLIFKVNSEIIFCGCNSVSTHNAVMAACFSLGVTLPTAGRPDIKHLWTFFYSS